MHFQLVHLSGPQRGKTQVCRRRRVRIGTAKDAAVRFPSGRPIARRHADIEFNEPECAFHLRAREGRVFVGDREVHEVILEDDDTIEVGLNGPRLRFKIVEGSTCKPVREMLRDARQARTERGLSAWVRSLERDLVLRSSWQLRTALLFVVVGLAFGAAYLGGALASRRVAGRQQTFWQEEAKSWSSRIEALQSQMHGQLEQFRDIEAQHASREELAALRADLAQRAQVVDALVARNAALQKVLDVYSRGVCLIYGVFEFIPPPEAKDIDPVEPIRIQYFGSGFLVSTRGHVITNRHVAEPWADESSFDDLLSQQFTPRFVALTAVFPGVPPVAVDPKTIELTPDGVDVAVMQVRVADVPVLPLHEGDLRELRGGPIILIGYPTGLNGVLARAEPELVAEVLELAPDTRSLVEELAKRGAVVPIITQGALNEVRPRRLVYDAETTFGGSGGPVFAADGTVIGVNFAVTRDFGGSNFGVPIEFARRLLPE